MESEPLPESIDELSLVFTNDHDIQELNKAYRNKDKPTDVLSFSQVEGEESMMPNTLLGDIVISLDTATEQAKSLEVTLDQELLRLLIHGILHLFGYDHEDVPEEEVKRMQEKEDELYEAHADSVSFT